jgi:hypothetical protein
VEEKKAKEILLVAASEKRKAHPWIRTIVWSCRVRVGCLGVSEKKVCAWNGTSLRRARQGDSPVTSHKLSIGSLLMSRILWK